MSLRKPIVFETPFTQYIGTDIVGEGGAGRVYKATGEDGVYGAVEQESGLRDSVKKSRRCKEMRAPSASSMREAGVTAHHQVDLVCATDDVDQQKDSQVN
jgi:hypothetical protein